MKFINDDDELDIAHGKTKDEILDAVDDNEEDLDDLEDEFESSDNGFEGDDFDSDSGGADEI